MVSIFQNHLQPPLVMAKNVLYITTTSYNVVALYLESSSSSSSRGTPNTVGDVLADLVSGGYFLCLASS